jgi:hypothetical protein
MFMRHFIKLLNFYYKLTAHVLCVKKNYWPTLSLNPLAPPLNPLAPPLNSHTKSAHQNISHGTNTAEVHFSNDVWRVALAQDVLAQPEEHGQRGCSSSTIPSSLLNSSRFSFEKK